MARRPRPVGVVLGLGAALVVTGCGLGILATMQSRPLLVLLLFLVGLVVAVGVPMLIGEQDGWTVALGSCLMFLLPVAAFGVGHAVLNQRGERTPATIVEIVRTDASPGTGEQYNCKLRLPDGSTRFLSTWDVCDASTRVGDRIHVYLDPDNRVGYMKSTAPWPWLTFPVVGTALVALTLTATVAASRAMALKYPAPDRSPSRSRKPGTGHRAPGERVRGGTVGSAPPRRRSLRQPAPGPNPGPGPLEARRGVTRRGSPRSSGPPRRRRPGG
ncbi:DUF3592 domain-containing protein [Streptomyces sp. NPDC001732]